MRRIGGRSGIRGGSGEGVLKNVGENRDPDPLGVQELNRSHKSSSGLTLSESTSGCSGMVEATCRSGC